MPASAISPDEAYALLAGGTAPDGLTVSGVLDYSPRSQRVLPPRFPAGLTAGLIDLSETAITEIPSGWKCFELNLSRTSICKLPADLQVESRLDLSRCELLEQLPDGLTVGTLNLGSCTALKELPEGLDVWFLDLTGCWAFEHWPVRCSIRGGRLQLRGCTAFGISVGVVGVAAALDEIERLRQALPQDVYLWVNAQQPRPRPYTEAELARFSAIDPLFSFTAQRQPSLGKPCRTGEVTFTVDGKGDMRRCHFVDQVIGNLYQPDWEQSLHPRSCPRKFCDCFLGKAQLKANELTPIFGTTLLERLPQSEGVL